MKFIESDNTAASYINNLTESSLSRLWKHNENHDCGAITAFRKYEGCDNTGREFTKKENLQRNKSLLAKLLSKGYSVTSITGVYPEGGTSSKEESFFVVDIKDNKSLLNDLKKLGESFNQDSILFVPKGSIAGLDKAFLIGTNHCPNNWLGYGKTQIFNKAKLGYDSLIYTSFVNGRPFLFENYEKEFSLPATGFGNWSLQLNSIKEWSEIEI